MGGSPCPIEVMKKVRSVLRMSDVTVSVVVSLAFAFALFYVCPMLL